MQFLVIVGSGVVTTYFGPFNSKGDIDQWARETETKQYVVVMMYPPFAPGTGTRP